MAHKGDAWPFTLFASAAEASRDVVNDGVMPPAPKFTLQRVDRRSQPCERDSDDMVIVWSRRARASSA